jgi:hypothetical protein
VCGCIADLWSARSLGPSAPKARETDEEAGGTEDVERYELLRARALHGDASGWRLGLAVLERGGVVAWTRAWSTTTSVPTAARQPEPVAVSDELVDALASMALACVSGG